MRIGDPLPDFSLPEPDCTVHSLVPGEGTAAVLVLFLCNHCPYVHRYAARIARLVANYQPKGVDIWGINSNDAERYPNDAPQHMPEMADRLGLPGRYLHDATQEVAHALRAERTPEAFLFNSLGMLAYRGAIDDNHEDEHQVKERYLEDALDAVLLNKQIQVDYAPPVGCSIKWKPHG